MNDFEKIFIFRCHVSKRNDDDFHPNSKSGGDRNPEHKFRSWFDDLRWTLQKQHGTNDGVSKILPRLQLRRFCESFLWFLWRSGKNRTHKSEHRIPQLLLWQTLLIRLVFLHKFSLSKLFISRSGSLAPSPLLGSFPTPSPRGSSFPLYPFLLLNMQYFVPQLLVRILFYWRRWGLQSASICIRMPRWFAIVGQRVEIGTGGRFAGMFVCLSARNFIRLSIGELFTEQKVRKNRKYKICKIEKRKEKICKIFKLWFWTLILDFDFRLCELSRWSRRTKPQDFRKPTTNIHYCENSCLSSKILKKNKVF